MTKSEMRRLLVQDPDELMREHIRIVALFDKMHDEFLALERRSAKLMIGLSIASDALEAYGGHKVLLEIKKALENETYC